MDLCKTLLSTQPIIALRSEDLDECLVKLTRTVGEAPSGVLLVEIDYLYQLLDVTVNAAFYDLKNPLRPQDAVNTIVEQLRQEANWELREPYFGNLELSISNDVFGIWVGSYELGCGQLWRTGADKVTFDYFTHVNLNPRSDRLLQAWLEQKLNASLAKKASQLTLFTTSLVIDLTNAFPDGILASTESACNYRALHGLTAELDHHTIVIKAPANLKFLSRPFLIALLKETIGNQRYAQYRNKWLFAGFGKYTTMVTEVLELLLPKE